LREILPSSGLVSGLDEVGQKDFNYTTYDGTDKKFETQNHKTFFSLRTWWLAEFFE